MSAHFDIRDAAPALEVLWAKPCVVEIRIHRDHPTITVVLAGPPPRPLLFPGATLAEAAHRACLALTPRAITPDPEDPL